MLIVLAKLCSVSVTPTNMTTVTEKLIVPQIFGCNFPGRGDRTHNKLHNKLSNV